MTYDELLAAAQRNPAEADFHTLRLVYAQSDAYAPYAHDVENVEALRVALNAGQMEAARAAIHNLLAANYLDIEAHMAADYVCLVLGDEAQSAYHRAFAKGLIDAILATGDGRGFDSAWIVLSIPEEYTVLRVLGLRSTGQELASRDGRWFDILTAQRPGTGETLRLYFDIDLPRGWLSQQMHDQDHQD